MKVASEAAPEHKNKLRLRALPCPAPPDVEIISKSTGKYPEHVELVS